MSKKLDNKKKGPVEFGEVEKMLRSEAIKEEYNIDGWLRDYINKPLTVKSVEFADRYIVLTVEYEGKTLRLASASKILFKKVKYLTKGIEKFGEIMIIPKIVKSKNNYEYLDI
jgi:hypothetical protein